MPHAEPSGLRRSVDRADLDLIGKAARLYYDFGLTHQEIAEILRISRVKVTRLLARARELGIVQITVNTDASPFAALEHRLVQRFGLEEAVVVPSFADPRERRAAISRGVATYLQRVLRDRMTVAIGFSRVIAGVPRFVAPGPRMGITFVPLVGGLGSTADAIDAHETTERLAKLLGGRAEPLHAPAVMASPEVADALRREPAIRRALDLAIDADLAIVGVGSIGMAAAILAEAGDIRPEELDRLAADGAVGNIAARFFDADGRSCDATLAPRLIGLTLDQIRAVPARLLVAESAETVVALRAALGAGMATTVITDAETVEAL